MVQKMARIDSHLARRTVKDKLTRHFVYVPCDVSAGEGKQHLASHETPLRDFPSGKAISATSRSIFYCRGSRTEF